MAQAFLDPPVLFAELGSVPRALFCRPAFQKGRFSTTRPLESTPKAFTFPGQNGVPTPREEEDKLNLRPNETRQTNKNTVTRFQTGILFGATLRIAAGNK